MENIHIYLWFISGSLMWLLLNFLFKDENKSGFDKIIEFIKCVLFGYITVFFVILQLLFDKRIHKILKEKL